MTRLALTHSKNSLLLFFAISVCCQCIAQSSAKTPTISGLKFISEFIVPHNQIFKSTTIGGLSGIDYDKEHDLYYLLSDDRSDINPVRFYTAKIRFGKKGIDTVIFSDVRFLLQPDGKHYASFKLFPGQSVDPEDIRFNAKTGELFWSSEGERIVNGKEPVMIKPSIVASQPNGKYVNTLPLPENVTVHATENGVRRNGAFEGISFNKDFTLLFAALEEPLYEDGPRAEIEKTNSYVRFFKFEMKTKKNTAQYAYRLEPVAFPAEPSNAFKINGVSEILMINDSQLLVIERSYSTGRLPCTIKVFLSDFSVADDVKTVRSLKELPPKKVMTKQLLLNMDDLGFHIDNVEGVTFGPQLPNGNASLIFVTDDNFQSKQKTQFLLFEVIP